MRRDEIILYVDVLRPLMKLADWTVVLDDDRPDGDAWASVEQVTYQRKVNLRVNDQLMDQAVEQIRMTLVHELIHLHLFDIEHATDRVRWQLGGGVGDVLESQIRLHVEYAVDQIAYALAPHLPLPPEARRRTDPDPTPDP